MRRSTVAKHFAMLSDAEWNAAYAFLDRQDYSSITEEQRWHSYHCWGRGGDMAWARIGMGGTMQMCALMWYHWMYKPGSSEIRPRVIFRAIVKAAGLKPTF